MAIGTINLKMHKLQLLNFKTMPQVAGVKTKKNLKGEITQDTFNVNKHKETIKPIHNQLGVMPKTKFQLECDKGRPAEEVFDDLLIYVKSLWIK